MSEGVDIFETESPALHQEKPAVKISNPFPEDRREAMSPDEKLKRWKEEQGERDKRAAQLMRLSKGQRRRTIIA
jgi:hypothetical protein